MRLVLLLACAVSLNAQNAGAIRASYTKYEYDVPMRDGVKLFTSVYVPKDATKKYPVLMQRTPYSVAPYGVDQYRAQLGPSEAYSNEGFIFAYQDVRGRYKSEGRFVEMRPQLPVKKSAGDIDESTDTYDTVDWLVKNVKGHNGKVGMMGISYPGFYCVAALIDAHPALVAVSPQAPVTDYYLGDDSYHNGAFMLAANFGFYTGFVERKGDPVEPRTRVPFDYQTPDGYDFYLKMGGLANADEKYFQRQNRYWTEQIAHPNYDDYWKPRSIWRYLKGVRPAVLTVGGWFDAEDLQGPLRVFRTLEKESPATRNALVMGPWTHGGWSRSDGSRVGNIDFASKTAVHFRDKIELAFFQHHLKDKQDVKIPKASMFLTGLNEWRQHDVWPPASSSSRRFYLHANGGLAGGAPADANGFDEYLSDPNRPVPYVGYVAMGMSRDYMTEDQRFASQRPDVLTYSTPPLSADLTVAGPIRVRLHASSSGTDSDFVVKLIDAFPGTFPGYPEPAQQTQVQRPQNAVRMGGYQQLVRGEPFRAKFRNSFEKPEPLTSNKPEAIAYEMPDVYHTFRRGHRIMVQVQSSWFPLTDRNPQKFMEIPLAKDADFQKATQRIYRSRERASYVEVSIEP
ncbi:MAG: CocE/NonD family hydrolase [Candidatus Solibacter usitatus]|nr:CocE/NonD family hydrolase [Candidatus Solibacter usitatus]